MVNIYQRKDGLPLLMGIVNVTPDSFSDGGQFDTAEKAIEQGLRLAGEGADILDIGGESTRPGAEMISVDEECRRVLPVIEGLRKAGYIGLISIDTRNAQTMNKSVTAGADIINDVSALHHDPQSMDVVLKLDVPIMLMHMQGAPENMQEKPIYNNVVEDVFEFLQERITACLNAGIRKENIIIDPGIGFGKTLEHNLKLINNLARFKDLGCPVLFGASRKRFIENIVPDTPAGARLPGSLAAAIQAVEGGADILRVHDVAETRQALAVWQAIGRA